MPKTRKDRPLTERQARFVREYIKDGNATQAAIRAGYARGSANREGPKLLSNPVISTMLARRTEKAEAAVDVSRERILKELVSIAYAPIGGEVVTPSDKIAAINRINKMQGYEIQRHEVSGPGGTPLALAVNLDALTDDELRVAQALAERLTPGAAHGASE